MPKLKVLPGGTVSDLTEIRQLERKIDGREHQLSEKQLYVFAYHFARLGAKRRTEAILDRISANYFAHDVFKDLYRAMLCWNVYKNEGDKRPELQIEAEFYVIFRRSLSLFSKLNFKQKFYFIKTAKLHDAMIDAHIK